jgi:hypothetical protein
MDRESMAETDIEKMNALAEFLTKYFPPHMVLIAPGVL